LGELYGRQKPFIISFGVFTAFNAACAAAPNIGALIVCRFLAGCFGSSPLTNAGGVIADMFPTSERGVAMAFFTTAPFMGPALGPICGGFLSMTVSWRWVEGLICVLSGTLWILGTLLVPETYAPVILRNRAKKLSELTGLIYVSKLDSGRNTSMKNTSKTALARPWALLFREPIVLLLSIYIAIIYGTLYMLLRLFLLFTRKAVAGMKGPEDYPFSVLWLG
jgi:multidrug resistance protein